LSFPQGYLSRAREADVALIGPFVNTAEFDFSGTALGTLVTRNDMAMLLYNFLLTNYRRVELVWNGVTGRYESVINTDPTIGRFGIRPIVGYITGVENYAMNINVRDYSPDLGSRVQVVPGMETVPDRPARFVGEPLTTTQVEGRMVAGVRQAFDVEISFGTRFTGAGGTGATGGFTIQIGPDGNLILVPITDPETTAADSNQWETSHILTTFDALGLTTPSDVPAFMANRYWLGKKVIVFTHAGVRRDFALPSAIPLGERTLINNDDNSVVVTRYTTVPTPGATPEVFLEYVHTITLGGVEYNQRTAATRDLDRHFNLYSWTRNGRLVADTNSGMGQRWRGTGMTGDRTRLIGARGGQQAYPYNVPQRNVRGRDIGFEEQLAAMIQVEGEYMLWRVDNGLNRRGEREFFYEFMPMEVGFLNNRTSGPNSWDNANNRVEMRTSHGYTRLYAYGPVATGDHIRPAGARVIPFFEGAEVHTTTLAPLRGHGYIFTNFGAFYRNVVLHERLTEITTDDGIVATFKHVDSRTTGTRAAGTLNRFSVMRFGTQLPNAEFDFNLTGARVINGIYAHDVSAAFNTGARYRLFTHPNDTGAVQTRPILLRVRTANAPYDGRNVRFVVVTSTLNSLHVGGGVGGILQGPNPPVADMVGLPQAPPITQATGGLGLGRAVQVMDTTGQTMGVVLSRNNPVQDADLANIRPGEFLAIAQNPDDTWTWAAVTANTTAGNNPAPTPLNIANGVRGPNVGLVRGGDNNNGVGTLGTGGVEAPIRPGTFAFELRHPNTNYEVLTLNNFVGLGSTDRILGDRVTLGNRVTLSSAGTLTVPGASTILNRRDAAVPNTVVIDANTRIIVFGPSTAPLANWGTPDNAATIHWAARAMDRTRFLAQPALLERAYRVAVITGGNPTNPANAYQHPNVAEVLFVSTTAGLDATVAFDETTFGVITNVARTTPVGQSLGTLLVVGRAPQFVASVDRLEIGQLVRLTGANANFIAPGETTARPLVAVVDDWPQNSTINPVIPGTVEMDSPQAVLAMNAQDVALGAPPATPTALAALAGGSPFNLDRQSVATVSGRDIHRAVGRVLNYSNHGNSVFIDVRTNTTGTGHGTFSVPAAHFAQLNVDARTDQTWSGTANNRRINVPLMGTGAAPGTNYVNTVLGPRNRASDTHGYFFNASGYYRGPANAIVWYDAVTNDVLGIILVRTRFPTREGQQRAD
jgi:hypothetical protein